MLIGTITAGVLAAAAIDLTGLFATIAVLAFLVVLVVVIVRLRRQAPARNTEMLRSIPAVPTHPSDSAVRPEPTVEPAPDWLSLIEKAEAEGDHAALAGLRLGFARAEIARGRNEPAAEQLRSSIRAAAKSRNASVQAEARLELAELGPRRGRPHNGLRALADRARPFPRTEEAGKPRRDGALDAPSRLPHSIGS